MDIEIRSVTLRTTPRDGEGWEFDALAAPYGREEEIAPGVYEQFTPGALRAAPEGVKLRLEHETTIGVVSDVRQADDGLYITARISDTTAGRDTRQLLADRALTGLSVGFRPDKDAIRYSFDDADDLHVAQTGGELLEVSLVTMPAYRSTYVDQIRSRKEKSPMPDSKPTPGAEKQAGEIAALREDIDLNTRSLAALKAEIASGSAPAAHPLAAYRSAGEYYKAYSEGETAGLDLRALTNGTMASDKQAPVWLTETLELMAANLRVTSLFTHSYTLPERGNTLEYPSLKTRAVEVAEQAAEGDALAEGHIEFDSSSTKVHTYGGYSKVSRQVVERSNPDYLDTIFTLQSLAYTKTIEKATRDLVKTTIQTRTAVSPIKSTAASLAALTVDELITVVLRMVEHYDENAYWPLTGLLVSPDAMIKLATLNESKKALQFAGEPDDKQGTLTVRTSTGEIAGIPVHSLPGTEGVIAGYSPIAVKVLESAGAPLRLSDEDVTNLTNWFSVYGYAAHYAPIPSAIVPVKFGA